MRRFSSVTLRDLQITFRRALSSAREGSGVALLAAPLAFTACAETPAKQPDSTTTVAVPSATSSDATLKNVPPAPSSTPPARLEDQCVVPPASQTGCGGGEAILPMSFAKCGLPEADKDLTPEQCARFCTGFPSNSCRTYSPAPGTYAVYCHAANPCMGRRPSPRTRAGVARSRRGSNPIVSHLKNAARMEALSVDAFAELETELARFGAPEDLQASCRRAAHDEARHATAMKALLEARGVRSRLPIARKTRGFDSLMALAIHNEREGVVGETWGALIASHQGQAASDLTVRAAMSKIAVEETEHAALSFQIAEWAREVLGPAAARDLDEVRSAAFANLRETVSAFPGEDEARTLGWPTQAEVVALKRAIEPIFWAISI